MIWQNSRYIMIFPFFSLKYCVTKLTSNIYDLIFDDLLWFVLLLIYGNTQRSINERKTLIFYLQEGAICLTHDCGSIWDLSKNLHNLLLILFTVLYKFLNFFPYLIIGYFLANFTVEMNYNYWSRYDYKKMFPVSGKDSIDSLYYAWSNPSWD